MTHVEFYTVGNGMEGGEMNGALTGSGPAGGDRDAARSGAPFVFVSYSRADGEFVGRLVHDLAEHGVACWVARDGWVSSDGSGPATWP